MAMLLIGSAALNIYVSHGDIRVPRDLDFIATFDEGLDYLKKRKCHTIDPANDGNKLIGFFHHESAGNKNFPIEIELAWPNSTGRKLLDWCANDTPTYGDVIRAPLDALYALKMSHRFKRNSPHFAKTMCDIHAMRGLGAKIPDSLSEWFKERERETYNYGHPKLNTTRKEFFAGDGIEYIYDHDSIHEAIKRFTYPAYNYFKPDTKEVFCSKEMFYNCDESVRLESVYEESAVLAIERSLVPHPGVLTPRLAFSKALEKVATSITSGWFREYAWENYHKVMALAEGRFDTESDYYRLFQTGLKNGIVKPFK